MAKTQCLVRVKNDYKAVIPTDYYDLNNLNPSNQEFAQHTMLTLFSAAHLATITHFIKPIRAECNVATNLLINIADFLSIPQLIASAATTAYYFQTIHDNIKFKYFTPSCSTNECDEIENCFEFYASNNRAIVEKLIEGDHAYDYSKLDL